MRGGDKNNMIEKVIRDSDLCVRTLDDRYNERCQLRMHLNENDRKKLSSWTEEYLKEYLDLTQHTPKNSRPSFLGRFKFLAGKHERTPLSYSIMHGETELVKKHLDDMDKDPSQIVSIMLNWYENYKTADGPFGKKYTQVKSPLIFSVIDENSKCNENFNKEMWILLRTKGAILTDEIAGYMYRCGKKNIALNKLYSIAEKEAIEKGAIPNLNNASVDRTCRFKDKTPCW